jgi:ABC-type dipeptide/oligopeptide/nickel transport system permease component
VLFVLGADGPIGRDELIRLLDGLRTSLEIALGAVIALRTPMRATLSLLIGGAVLVVLLAAARAISGSRIGSWADRMISFGALVLVCFHPMMLGLILRNAGGRIHGLPTSGYCTFGKHTVSPAQANLYPPGFEPCGGPKQLGGAGLYIVLPSVLSIVVLITLIVVVGNLVVDALYAVLDPRVGIQQNEQRTKSLVGGVF